MTFRERDTLQWYLVKYCFVNDIALFFIILVNLSKFLFYETIQLGQEISISFIGNNCRYRRLNGFPNRRQILFGGHVINLTKIKSQLITRSLVISQKYSSSSCHLTGAINDRLLCANLELSTLIYRSTANARLSNVLLIKTTKTRSGNVAHLEVPGYWICTHSKKIQNDGWCGSVAQGTYLVFLNYFYIQQQIKVCIRY